MKHYLLFAVIFSCSLTAQETMSPKPGITVNGATCLIGNLVYSCTPKTCDSITIMAGDSLEFCTFQEIYLNTDTAFWLQWHFYGAANLPDTILNDYPSATPICHWPRWDSAGTFMVEVFYNGWLSAYPSSDCYQYGPSHWYIQVNVLANPNAIVEQKSSALTVAPNPSDGFFSIRGVEHPPGQIVITDVHGREILRTRECEIDMTGYPAGVYVAVIYSGRVSQAVKLIVQ